MRAVAFAEHDSVVPPSTGDPKDHELGPATEGEKSSKQFRASLGRKRLSGRPSIERMSTAAKASIISNPSISSVISEDTDLAKSPHKHRHAYDRLSKQVTAWLQQEKTRRTARKAKRAASKEASRDAQTPLPTHASTDHPAGPATVTDRRGSDSSEGSAALEHLANILERTMSLKSNESSPRKRRSSHGHKLSSIMKRGSVVSSDTDYFDGAEDLVPSCEAILDNSKTMAYSGGGAEPLSEGVDSSQASRSSKKEREAWATFKYEIVRITHTLRLKGWRRVPLDQSNEIEVTRLSGALTNAVYVVSPPKDIRPPAGKQSSLPAPKNPPP